MSDSTAVASIARFGPFELDVRSGELRKSGVRVRLQEQPVRLLCMLLEKRGDVVSREELCERIWPAGTFVDFEHGLNTAMRKLRAALNDSADTPRFVETLARRGYRFIAPVEWVDVQERATPRRDRRPLVWMGVVAAALLIGAIAVVALRAARKPPPLETPPRALAVLPFTTDDPSVEYVSDGLTELLITELSQWRDLRVMARTTVFRFKGMDPREAGRRLGVDAVLTGALRKAPRQYELSMELVDVRDGTQLWGKQVSGGIADVASVQRILAAELTSRLELPPRPRRDPRASPAYPYYLRGLHYWNKRGNDDLRKAIEYFDRALELDPEFALGYAGLANVYGVMAGMGRMPKVEGTLKAKAAAERALAIDPELVEAHTSLAAGKCGLRDFEGCERDFRRALELNPGYPSAHQWYSQALLGWGRLAEARKHADIAYNLDPLSGPILATYCRMYFVERRFEEAIACGRRAHELNPEFFPRPLWVVPGYVAMKNYDAAIDQMRRNAPFRGDLAEPLAAAYAQGGERAFWRKRIELWAAARDRGEPVPDYTFAQFHSRVGDADQAFLYLERSLAADEPESSWWYDDPRLDGVRSDPRFVALARRIGLPQVQGSGR